MSAMVLKATSRLEGPSLGEPLVEHMQADLAHPGVKIHFLGFSAHDWGRDVSEL
jgi:hypothetical protein